MLQLFESCCSSAFAFVILYVKTIIGVRCALSRGSEERRTNANNCKDSDPELSEGRIGADTHGKNERTENKLIELVAG